MKILLIGATGFIGRNLLKSFPANNVVPVNVREEGWQKIIPRDAKVFINLIGKAHDHKNKTTEKEYYKSNVEVTTQIFSEFLKLEASLFIHISSIAAVEEFESFKPLNEKDVCRPTSSYGKTKRDAEIWLLNQNLPKGKKIVILRPPMVHGEGDKGNLKFLYKFITAGVPYPLSAFDNSRSFLSIENLYFFIQEIINKQDKLASGIYHIADDEVISTKDIVEAIKRIKNKKNIHIYIPKSIIRVVARVGDFISIPLNTERLKKMTGDLEVSNHKLKNTLGIDKLPFSAIEGLEKTIKSYK